jgi:hypothetical protein
VLLPALALALAPARDRRLFAAYALGHVAGWAWSNCARRLRHGLADLWLVCWWSS